MFHFEPKLLIAVILVLILFREWQKGYFKRVGVYRQSLSLKPYLPFFLFLSIGVAIFLPFDLVLLKAIQSFGEHHPRVIDFGSFIGRNVNCWAILAGGYGLVLLATRGAWCERVFGAILGSALTGLACLFLKSIFLRARPYAGLGPLSFFNWDGFFKDARAFQSFPSGDVALVSGAALYFFYASFDAGKNRYLPGLLFLIPLTTALARVSLNRHWFSDTLGAIGLGLIVSKLVWDYQVHFRRNR